MSRVVIVGGYGAFGSRIAERLARRPVRPVGQDVAPTGSEDIEIVIAGRKADAAAGFAEDLARRTGAKVSSAVIDAARVSAADLAQLQATVVVNASGPFQEQDYALARACIAARSHYVDIADARRFVTGITALDAEAKAAGVVVVSGASSVPGVSSAAVAALAPRFAAIETIRIAISPGSGFEPGLATAAAGLSYLGQPIQVPGRPEPHTVRGWQGLKRLHFPGLGRRWTGHCDVPDLDLFPAHYPALKRIEFRAGLEVATFQIGLWLLSWPARAGLIRKPERLAGTLTTIRNWFSGLGTNRGGMRIDIAGQGPDGRPLDRVWSIASEGGDGLYVPTLGAVILARRLARGEPIPAGAGPCFERFDLAEVRAEIEDLRIVTGPRPLYRRLLGRDFDRLPLAVRRLHEVRGSKTWWGAASVEHGPSLAARIAARMMPFPRASRGLEPEFCFIVAEDGDSEIWARGFAGRADAAMPTRAAAIFRSRQTARDGLLSETVKGFRFGFRVEADEAGQRLQLERLSWLGVPVPRRLHPAIATLESESDGRYQFRIEASLPLGLGLLVSYAGWLVPTRDEMLRHGSPSSAAAAVE